MSATPESISWVEFSRAADRAWDRGLGVGVRVQGLMSLTP